MSEKRCYTVQELQEILGVSRPTIYNLLKKKEFRWIQLDGGKYRISKKSFDDWLAHGVGNHRSTPVKINAHTQQGVDQADFVCNRHPKFLSGFEI
jgi:excisionase family DNA binding protein